MSFTANRMRQGAAGAAGDYEIDSSLRFNDDDSAYLSWTPTSAGNRRTWTWSGWVKISEIGVLNTLLGSGTADSDYFAFRINSNGTVNIHAWNGGYQISLNSSAAFRDPSAHYHFLLVADTTNGTASQRLRLYSNGVEVTLTGTAPSQNYDTRINNSTSQYLGWSHGGHPYFDGYLAEVNFIDGSALAPTDFGEFDATYGHWKAKEYAGSYTGNSFYLPFTNDTTNDHFNTVLYAGNSTNNTSINGFGFQPDLVWVKNRSISERHMLTSVLNTQEATNFKWLDSSATNAEFGTTGLKSFDSDGFTLGTWDSTWNQTGNNYVAWGWKAGGTASSNTNGSITSQVSANPDQGFSIVSYTGNRPSVTTVGHGLNSAPEMIFIKNRDRAGSYWMVYNATIGNTTFLKLNTTAATASSNHEYWDNTSPTSTVFTVKEYYESNYNGENHIAYCWHSVAGYSKIGSYTGNGSTTGPVVTTGFKVAWLLVKCSTAAEDWWIVDNVRSGTNPKQKALRPSKSNAESDNVGYAVDFNSDGFQIKATSGQANANGGTYIYMAIADTSVIGDVTNDQSGLKNHWSGVNLTASDVMLDSPTNNFATLNPLGETLDATLSEGNTKYMNPGSTAWDAVLSTFGVSSGKWYWEVISVGSAPDNDIYGIADTTEFSGNQDQYVGQTSNSYGIYANPGATNLSYYNNGSATGVSSAPPWAIGDVLSIALDMDNGKIWWAKNGTFYNSGNPASGTGANVSGLSGEFSPAFSCYVSGHGFMLNAGQDATFAGNKSPSTTYSDGTYGEFFYQPPSGFKALCSLNISDPAVVPGEHFNAVTYTGNGGTQSITGAGFQPDFVWAKQRDSGGGNHVLFDSVRGTTKMLASDISSAEETQSGVTAFNSDGFTVGSWSGSNNNTASFISWLWKAGGTAVSNTNGSITSSVSANTDGGFSIISYTGNGTSGATVGHGLSPNAPELVIVKSRSLSGKNWPTYHIDEGNTKRIKLNSTDAAGASSAWNNTTPSANLVTLGSQSEVNTSGATQIMYCFHSVAGYSKIGLYFGNGNADGPFIFTGFQPKYILWKQSRESGENWRVIDDTRSPYNQANKHLAPSSSSAESTETGLDFLSNGFKWRNADWHQNQNGKTYIYMAFAEYPFKFSNAR